MRRALLVSFVSVAACATPERSSPLPMTDPHSHSVPSRVRVTHVSLDVELEFARRELRGSVELALERIDPNAPLVVDTQGLAIRSARGSDGMPRAFELGVEHDGMGAPLTIALAPLDRSVRIEYATTPASAALQWLEPAQTADGKAPFLFTQGQAILTRTWIPLQDSPGVRVTYDARVRAPAGATVVMSARQLGKDADGAFRFELDRPIPPYLIALACGEIAFEPISKRCGVWAEPSVVSRARAELDDTEAMIAAAEELFGPYRWGRYDLIVLPPSFPYGGMENPCLTFATPTILAGDKSLVGLVAHELAHSWSGNLVTNATWRDFWLNEGFTVYFEQRIMERVFGVERSVMEKELSLAELRREMADLAPRDQVLHVELAGRHPDDGFSGVPYTKGASFLWRIEEVFGRERFDPFLRRWFDEHAFQSVTTQTFLAFLQRELFDADPARAREIDVERWLEQPGLPPDTLEFSSRSLADAREAARRVLDGARAGEIVVDGWVTQQWLLFLQALAARADARVLADLDARFALTKSGNAEILCEWLRLAIECRYAPADAALEQFLGNVGRRKFLQPLYKELAKTEAGKARALELYRRFRPRYHAVSTGTLDKQLGVVL